MSAIQIKYDKNGKITGAKFGFEAIPMISKIVVNYGKIDNSEPVKTIIEATTVDNQALQTGQRTVGFKNSYTIKNIWYSSAKHISNYIISPNINVQPLSLKSNDADATVSSIYSTKS